MISAARLGCRHGRIVPLVVPAWHTPGISANVRGDRGAGYVSVLRRQGYVEIPHDRLPCTAWGESRAGGGRSSYLDRYEGVDRGGRGAVRWVDAWTRPRQIGHLVSWEQDAAGRDAFLIAALMDLANRGDPLHPVQIELAVRPVALRIENAANRDTPRSRRLIEQMYRHIPPEHVPDSVRTTIRRIMPDLLNQAISAAV